MSDTKTVKRADSPTFLGNLIATVLQLTVIAVLVVASGAAARLIYEGVLFGWNAFF